MVKFEKLGAPEKFPIQGDPREGACLCVLVHMHAHLYLVTFIPAQCPPLQRTSEPFRTFLSRLSFPVHYNPHHLPGFRSPGSPGLLLEAIQDPQIKLLNQTS